MASRSREGVTQAGRSGTVPRVSRYSLSYKAAPDGGATATPGRSRDPNPAMLQRPDQVDLDHGREWSGDLFETGQPSDPSQAFARFSGEEVEAWLDRAEDGTLTGWLRESDTGKVWRYSDADAWAIDVDGAELARADAGPSPVDTAAGGPPDGAAEEEPEADGEFPSPDELTEEPPPETPPQDATGSEEPAAQGEHGGEHGRRYDAARDRAGEDVTEDQDDEFNLFAGPHTRKRRSTEKKHNPGGHPHNQESHGNWSEGVSAPKVDAGDSSSGPFSGDSSGPRPRTAQQARISPETLAKMNDQQLEAVVTSGDRYDQATMHAVMAEMDARDDLTARGAGLAGHQPNSPEEIGAFDSAFPDTWVAWVTRPDRALKGSRDKQKAARQVYDELVESQFQRAEEDTNGNLLNKRGRREGASPRDLFRSRDKLRRFGSEELKRWFGAHTGNKHQTFEQFAADELGWETYKRLRDRLESDYLSEHGG